MSTASEAVASLLLHNGGYRVDPQRLDDRVAADRSRERVNRSESVRRLEGLAIAAKKATRDVELAHWDWSRSSTPENLAAVSAAQAHRTAAQDALLEACCHDQELYADVVRRYGR